MTIAGFRARNHPQQVGKRGADHRIDERGTAQELFDALNARFGFTLDAAALPENAKCERFFSPIEDGLAQRWGGRVWCNPPYSDIPAWLAKAWCAKHDAELIVMLLPANRTEQPWWHRYVEPFRDRSPLFRVEFIPGRQRFVRSDTFVDLFGRPRGASERPPFGVCLLIWTQEDVA